MHTFWEFTSSVLGPRLGLWNSKAKKRLCFVSRGMNATGVGTPESDDATCEGVCRWAASLSLLSLPLWPLFPAPPLLGFLCN